MRDFSKYLFGLILKLRLNCMFRKKISGICRNIRKKRISGNIPGSIMNEYKNKWRKFGRYHILSWLKAYSIISGCNSADYVPENIYYSEIEPRLNFKPYSKAFTDKNFYDIHLKGIKIPVTFLRNMNGVFYDIGYNMLSENDVQNLISGLEGHDAIIKPTMDTGGGAGVRMIHIEKDGIRIYPETEVRSVKTLLAFYKSDFIIQEFLDQHPFFSQFNKSSLNTVRILTYRSVKDERIRILHRILRTGRPGMIVDNQSSGGIACSIASDGMTGNYGVDKYGNKYSASGDIVFSAAGKVNYIGEISHKAVEVAARFPYSRLLGLDFCVNKQGVIFLLEVNDINNEINFYQMTSGPLFGIFTDEIVEYCRKAPKSVMVDFNIG